MTVAQQFKAEGKRAEKLSKAFQKAAKKESRPLGRFFYELENNDLMDGHCWEYCPLHHYWVDTYSL
jgi:hypothetical protein